MSKWSEIERMSAAAQAFAKQTRAAEIAVFIDLVMPRLIDTAKVSGYALGVHGSRARDLDIIACPWTEQAVDADELVKRLCATCREATGWGHLAGHRAGGDWVAKPHGRRACTILGSSDVHLDLSVMPLRPNEIVDGDAP